MGIVLQRAVGRLLSERSMMIAVAESCTGGLVGHMITGVPGSSGWFKGGIIAYSNEVKKDLLGVSPETLKGYGAVSSKTAKEMAVGVKKKLKSDIGLAVTGIAGPAGGSSKKPVGTVFIALAWNNRAEVKRLKLSGSRGVIKKEAAASALRLLLDFLTET